MRSALREIFSFCIGLSKIVYKDKIEYAQSKFRPLGCFLKLN